MSDTETTVRSLYAALERGDAAAALALFDPHIKWTEAKSSPYYQGTVEGVDAVVKTVLEPIANDFDKFVIEPVQFVTESDRCAAFGLYSGPVRATGRHLEADFVHLWTVRDGRLTSFRQYTDGAAWIEAFAKR
ncbi:nuclear transport factor 2 family protein [Paraburkholderia sp. DHOC27]|uniref:nuclear transport factor 2 family protein n=1 Tax=Paraburkholderia sp. DHOC27 TaxID=2303330 RepID=UPI0015F310C5|nr:nuclear transport factor 2 family protein [Paraburkholderia sp. DHOC27]